VGHGATETGYYIDPLILSYPPRHSWSVATGWDLRNSQALRANNLGFAAERDFVPDRRAVVLIGDSFVEASMLDAAARPGPQLARALGDARPIYAMGGPGSALLDYAERIRYAYQRLDARNFVVLMESGDVRQSICGSGNVHGPCLDDRSLLLRIQTLPAPSLAKRLLRQSAFAQFVAGQLKADFKRVAATAFIRATPEQPRKADDPGKAGGIAAATGLSEAGRARVAAVADAFWLRIAEVAPQARIVFVVDGGRSPEVGPVSDIQLERQHFIEIARARGHTVVDGVRVFAEHWANSQLSLSVGPYDGHMNGYAVSLIMRATAQELRRESARDRD
jgi:hypothetical protein